MITHRHIGEGGGAGSAGEPGECLSLKESQAEKYAWHQALLGLSSSQSHNLFSHSPQDCIRGFQKLHMSSEYPVSWGCLPVRRPLSVSAATSC